MNTKRELIDELVVTATLELFSSIGVELALVERIEQLGEVVAVIGFSAASVRGALGLALRSSLVDESLVKAGGDPHERGACDDFAAELANQLLGRVKNKMRRYGVELAISLPTILRGVELRLVRTGCESVLAYAFKSGDGEASVWLDARFADDFVMELQDEPAVPEVLEGELTLF